MVEVKKRTEEMKMEIMSLGSQKAELNSKILDMQSTISSLREEQRAVEIAFQEKQNEVKTLRDKDQDPQVEALREELRHKEAENQDLKHRLQLRGAAVEHERLILPSNATAENRGGDVQDGETESIDRSSENGGIDADGRSEKKVDHEKERREKEEHEDDEARVTARGESRDNQEMEVHGGRMNLETQENTHRLRGKRGYLRRAKGKRWRSIAKQTQGKRTSPGNAAASTLADQALVRGDELPDVGRGEGEATSNVGSYSEENNGETSEKRPPGNELRGSIHRDETEDLSRTDLKNSTLEETREEIAKKPVFKMEDTGSANKNAEDRNEQQHTDLLGRKEGKPDAEESELGEDSEEREETDEPEF